MDLFVWIMLALNLPLAVAANMLTPRVQAWRAQRRDQHADLDERRRRLRRGQASVYLQEPILLSMRLTAATALLVLGVGAIGVVLGLMLLLSWEGADLTGFPRSVVGLSLSVGSMLISIVFGASTRGVTKAFQDLAGYRDARLEQAKADLADAEAALAAEGSKE